MKKAKIILTVIAVLGIVGVILAFKIARFTEVQLWTISGTTRVTKDSCSTIVPLCTTSPFFATVAAPGLVLVNGRVSAAGQVVGTCPGGKTTLISFIACPTFQTFATIVE